MGRNICRLTGALINVSFINFSKCFLKCAVFRCYSFSYGMTTSWWWCYGKCTNVCTNVWAVTLWAQYPCGGWWRSSQTARSIPGEAGNLCIVTNVLTEHFKSVKVFVHSFQLFPNAVVSSYFQEAPCFSLILSAPVSPHDLLESSYIQ